MNQPDHYPITSRNILVKLSVLLIVDPTADLKDHTCRGLDQQLCRMELIAIEISLIFNSRMSWWGRPEEALPRETGGRGNRGWGFPSLG
jgi:hypothetical protein